MAGRTISAANEAKLRAAMEALSAVMASMDSMSPADGMKNAAKEADDQTEAEADAPVVEAALEGDIVPLAEAKLVELTEYSPLTSQAG